MSTRLELRHQVERKVQQRMRQSASGTEALQGNTFSEEKINDALNESLGWMDVVLEDVKNGRAYMNLTTVADTTVYTLPMGVKQPIISARYDAEGTPVDLKRIVIRRDSDRIATEEGSFFQPSANQAFFADSESDGVDGIEIFINGSVTAGKKIYYWARLEFDQYSSDDDDFSLGTRLDLLQVDYATYVCLRDSGMPEMLSGAQEIIKHCENMAQKYNSWRT